jgi:signal recognition particle subunit SRP54
MFENLTEKFDRTFKRLKGQGKLSEKHLKEALREVRLALLEADVNYKVAKQFVTDLAEQAAGEEVRQSLTPGRPWQNSWVVRLRPWNSPVAPLSCSCW